MKRDSSLLPEVKKVTKKKTVTAISVAKSKTNGAKAKTTTKKAPIIKKATKKVTKKEIKKVSLPGVIVDQSETKDKETVFVPKGASLRLLEKVEIYKLWYQEEFPNYAAKVARVTGYSLVLLGTLLSAGAYLNGTYLRDNLAATVCADGACLVVEDDDLAPTVPLVTFLNSLPNVLTDDIDIAVRITGEDEPKLILKNVDSSEVIVLEPRDRFDDKEATYLIEFAKLKPGYYELSATTASAQAEYTYLGPTFVVSGQEEKPFVSKKDEIIAPPTTSSTTDSHVEDVPEVVTESEDTDESEKAEPEVEEVSIKPSFDPIALSITESNNSVFAKIKVGAHTPETVLIYARSDFRDDGVLLGAATLVQNEWIFNLSALETPTTDALVYGSFVSQGRTYLTNSLSYRHDSEPELILTSDADIKILVDKISLALKTSEVNNETRLKYFDYIASTTNDIFIGADELKIAESDLMTQADTLLTDNSELLNGILFKYALGVQAQSSYLEEVAKQRGLKAVNALAGLYTNKDRVTTFETLLRYRLIALFDRVREIEQGISDSTKNLTATDTDGDGISDFDELANTLTDPALGDTDSDGVLDGIEIVFGSDALNATLNLSASKQSPLTTSGALIVNRVSNTAVFINGKTRFYPLIVGKGLPNSFVFVKIQGTDDFGVIKTGVDGTFHYTFEHEIADGTYDVQLYYPDSEGQAVVGSEVYTFKKTDGELSAGALFSDYPHVSGNSESSNIPYVVAAAIAVSVFGFVLLLLAESLNKRRRSLPRLKV